MTDLFDRAYAEGVYEAIAPPATRGGSRDGHDGPRPAAAPSAPFALRGAVITPDAAWDDGYVVVDGGSIAAVQQAAPRACEVLDTGGVILPGLIDLHGHPEFNVFAAWEPPTPFTNRYQWRGQRPLPPARPRPAEPPAHRSCRRSTELRYAEIRALVGGVTGDARRQRRRRQRPATASRWSATSTCTSSGSTGPAP